MTELIHKIENKVLLLLNGLFYILYYSS